MKQISFILTIALLAVASCQQSEPSAQQPVLDRFEIVGKWVIESATRNGRSTESLADAYFQFDTPDKISTNVFGAESTQPILWRDSVLMVSDSSMHYKVMHLENDSLMLNFQLQQYTFDLFLSKESANDSLELNAASPLL